MTHTLSQGQPLELPPGWLDCPPFGRPPTLDGKKALLNLIPSKVPLSYDYAHLIPTNKMYTLRDAVARLKAQNQRVRAARVLWNPSDPPIPCRPLLALSFPFLLLPPPLPARWGWCWT
jgi:hypothetical protein